MLSRPQVPPNTAMFPRPLRFLCPPPLTVISDHALWVSYAVPLAFWGDRCGLRPGSVRRGDSAFAIGAELSFLSDYRGQGSGEIFYFYLFYHCVLFSVVLCRVRAPRSDPSFEAG